MVRIDKMRYFNIYSNIDGGYIVHNLRKPFDSGHTHINSYKTSKYVAYMALYKKVPKRKISAYLIQSIIRISTDKDYIRTLEEILTKTNHTKSTRKQYDK